MRIELEYEKDELTKELYIFWFDDSRSTLWVDEYQLLQRESKRHKHKKIKYYERLRERKSNISKEEVPLNDKIKNDVVEKLVINIKVDYWKER